MIRPLTEEEYGQWAARTIPAFAKEKVESGAWTPEEALDKSRADLARLLPEGKDTKDNFLYAIVGRGGEPVGVLWFAIQERAGARIAYLYNIEIDAAHRRQGHAQRALEALEAEAARLGLAGVALHVFGHNTSAHALYVKQGYAPTNINMFKAVRRA